MKRRVRASMDFFIVVFINKSEEDYLRFAKIVLSRYIACFQLYFLSSSATAAAATAATAATTA